MKKILVSLGLAVMILAGAVLPGFSGGEVYAADSICDDDNLKATADGRALLKAAGCSDFGTDKPTAVPIALNIINVVLSFVGLIAVGVIIYGGILYVTSTGDSAKIHKAKNCILYGVVGLVVAIMAFAIVAFINTSVLKKG